MTLARLSNWTNEPGAIRSATATASPYNALRIPSGHHHQDIHRSWYLF